jgi:hypothetical protein
MLFPFTRSWTRRQKWLIVTSVVLALLVLGSGIYAYERYYRGPGEEAFYGTWESPDFFPDGDNVYLQFRPDQTFSLGGIYDGEFSPYFGGRWYAGGSNFYLRFSADVMEAPQPISVLHIVAISPDEFRLKFPLERGPCTFRRFATPQPNASNQTMERTADRSAPHN